jgi:localization factor PodJL
VFVSKAEMADVLQSARGKTRTVPGDEKPRTATRLRWLTIGALSLLALFLCVGLTMGDTARAARRNVDGIAYRHVAHDEGARIMALADAGNADAQARLALAYLRGAGVARDPSAAARWSAQAARAGQPVAQYLLGALYSQGSGVAPDPARALTLFTQAASRGNLKAMHNLAIAYAEGSGVTKNDVQAAQWFERAARRGYVDSAFDLAVLYERGRGVKQDLAQALSWYLIAAQEGDAASGARAAVLRGQLGQAQARQANDAARDFTPVAAPPDANRLPAL